MTDPDTPPPRQGGGEREPPPGFGEDDLSRQFTDMFEADYNAGKSAGFREGLEEAAKVVAGQVYKQRYREWTFQGGNRSADSEIVKFADSAAAAIRALPIPDPLTPEQESGR